MNNKGFTIIELIVVIAIIAVLAAIVMVSVSGYLTKARDSRRISDLNNIRKALDMYFADNGNYPAASCGYDCNGYYYSTDTNGGWKTLGDALKPYIASLPIDPINNCQGPWNDVCYSYSYGNVGKDTYTPQYDLSARLETPNHSMSCYNMNWRLFFNQFSWCTRWGGAYTNQMYEGSPR